MTTFRQCSSTAQSFLCQLRQRAFWPVSDRVPGVHHKLSATRSYYGVLPISHQYYNCNCKRNSIQNDYALSTCDKTRTVSRNFMIPSHNFSFTNKFFCRQLYLEVQREKRNLLYSKSMLAVETRNLSSSSHESSQKLMALDESRSHVLLDSEQKQPLPVDLSKWERVHKVKVPSKNNPEKQIELEVIVLDTNPEDVDQALPTIVAVHGMPGSGRDFEQLTVCLQERGIRFVVPTSFGMEQTPFDMSLLPELDFSTKARAQNLRTLLNNINISRIDMLIGHSAGGWTVYEAAANWSNIGSLALINPGGAEPNRALRPFLMNQMVAMALHWSFIRFFMLPIIAFVMGRLGFKGMRSGPHLVSVLHYTTQQGFEQVPDNAARIHEKQIPLLFAYATNDKVLEPSISHSMAHKILRIPEENVVTYDDDETPNRDPFFVPSGWLARCLLFARGGHIVHVRHLTEVRDQILDLLEHIGRAPSLEVKEKRKT